MDPRKLLYFVSIVEQGSLKKAAGTLNLSQPALSTSMDRLETSLGIKLLERNAKGATPTPMGELIFSHARLIKDEIELARNQVQTRGQKANGVLTIGVLPSLASNVVPLALTRWRAEYPTLRVRIVEKVQIELLIGLLRGDLDLFIGMTEYYDILEGLKQRVIFRDRQRVFARPRHPVFNMQDVTWRDIVQFPWVCPMVGSQRTVLESLLQSQQIAMPRQIIEGGSVQFVKTLVSSSDHLAILPSHTISEDVKDGKLRFLPLTSQMLSRNIAVFHRLDKHLGKSSHDLIAYVEAVGLRLCREPRAAVRAKP